MWQPIETLSKTEASVLIVAPAEGHGYNLYVGWVCPNGRILAGIGYLDERGVKPTHWMEIPDPPVCPTCGEYPPPRETCE
jgi:hypothetical protein